MTIDRRFDFVSFLARRRETLSGWLERTGVRSYDELSIQLEKLGARALPRAVYESAVPVPQSSSPAELVDAVGPASADDTPAVLEEDQDSPDAVQRVDLPSKARRRAKRPVEDGPQDSDGQAD